jgi:hypothetical protein
MANWVISFIKLKTSNHNSSDNIKLNKEIYFQKHSFSNVVDSHSFLSHNYIFVIIFPFKVKIVLIEQDKIQCVLYSPFNLKYLHLKKFINVL